MKTVLVVDDEFDLASTLRAILEGEGHRVEVAANGRDALDRLREARPDLVLLDVMMPVVGGYEVLAAIRQAPGLAGVPVVLMNSSPPPAGTKADGFLRKPFTLDELLGAVEKLLGKADPAASGG